jgi:O-succinylbenzoic acid--CoA ligase
VALVPSLIAVDLPASTKFVEAVLRVWNEGNVVLPVDQRLPQVTKNQLYTQLGVDAVAASPNDFSSVSFISSQRSGVSKAHLLEALVPGDALVIATSGTTGNPKGVVHTHQSLQASADMVGRRLNLSSEDHWWLCIPAAHIGGFGVIARSLHHRSRLTFGNAEHQRTIDDAVARGANRTSVVPTLVNRHNFGGFTTVLVGGAPSHQLPTNAVSTYGLTETAGGIAYDGRALSNVDVLVREGEILLRTPTLARTYRDGPLSLRDGWLATGDMGRMVDGRLVVDGRKDDLIITGGVKVWPHVIEARLREHPLIKDVVVAGKPDSEWGEIVVAYVECASSQPPTLKQLRSHMKETLSPAHAPKRLVVMNSIPRTTLGKVRRSELPSA